MNVICFIWLQLLSLITSECAPWLMLKGMVEIQHKSNAMLQLVRQTWRPLFGFSMQNFDVLIGWSFLGDWQPRKLYNHPASQMAWLQQLSFVVWTSPTWTVQARRLSALRKRKTHWFSEFRTKSFNWRCLCLSVFPVGQNLFEWDVFLQVQELLF